MQRTESASVLLGEPLPVDLMNTVVMQRDGAVRDELETSADIVAWLQRVHDRIQGATGMISGAVPGGGEDRAFAQLRELRSALRRLAMDATGDPRPPMGGTMGTRAEAVAALNGFAKAWPELAWPRDGEPRQVIRAAGSQPEVAVRLIAHQAVELFGGEHGARLRACLAPNCSFFFVKDHSRREWCSQACGNRARVARHYRRHRPPRDEL
ncbi:CGNR zinc finger domain-containing protein [Amycolatopsis sp. NPDC051903]|uniref:CGNR zinc finger domain-containing protein n=1 Tax=Amycolatopsis sp. NPDC051903 TaxID=3363936 RepID=UPI0037B1916A